jgi:hypothetical protein
VTDLTERVTERHEPGLAPDPPDHYEQQPADPPPTLPLRVTLSRLIGLARLTAPQALEIGAGLLAEAARRSEQDAGSPGSDRFTIDQVLVGADGRVVFGPASDRGPSGRPSVAGPARSAVEAGLADLAGAARPRTRRPDAAAERLVAELDRAMTDLPVVGVPVVARRLRDAAAEIDRGAVRAEIAALVRAVGGGTGPAGGGPAGATSTVVRAPPARGAPDGEARPVKRRVGAWLFSILVLATVVLLEVALLRDDIAADIDLLFDAGRSGSTPSEAPAPDGLPTEWVAPAAAGAVAAVELRPLAQCGLGAPCTVRVLVRLVPGVDPREVTWSYRIVDRCTGAAAGAPGGSVAVPAEGERAMAVGTVPVPAARAVAVVAVTELPAVAASPPVLVGSCLSDRRVG